MRFASPNASRPASLTETAASRTRYQKGFCRRLGLNNPTIAAAGVAAAVAIEESVTVRKVPIGKVQDALRKLAMPLHAAELK